MTTNQRKTKKLMKWTLCGAMAVAGISGAARAIESGKLVATDTAGPTTYRSPEEAATALAQAAKNGDEDALVKVLGGEAKALISSGETETDKAAMRRFYSKYQQMNRWVDMSDGSRVLYIGSDNFAFPVPLAKNSSDSWYFDGVAGEQEIRAREIGKNELLTIDALAAVANAERFFSANSESGEYAQRIISTTGKQDGLYWPASNSLGTSPLAQLEGFPRSSLPSLSPKTAFRHGWLHAAGPYRSGR